MTLPMLAFSLIAGVWVDRRQRKPILLATDLGRATLLGFIPLAAATEILRIEHLYIVGIVFGTMSVFFHIAYQTYLPSLIDREQLVEGNGKMTFGASAAQIGGPGLAGLLVQAIGPATAILVDAVSFLFAGMLIRAIRTVEPPVERARQTTIRGDVLEGVRLVLSTPVLRGIAGCSAAMSICGGMFHAVFVLYAVRELDMGGRAIGLTFAAGSVGFLVGGLLNARIARHLGIGRMVVGSAMLMVVAQFLVPLAATPGYLANGILAVSWFGTSLASAGYAINQLSLRQSIAPPGMLGRINASMQFLTLGPTPLAALLGGVLGSTIGLRATLIVAAVVLASGIPWLLSSPVPRLRDTSDLPVLEATRLT
jgi:MFS family permease